MRISQRNSIENNNSLGFFINFTWYLLGFLWQFNREFFPQFLLWIFKAISSDMSPEYSRPLLRNSFDKFKSNISGNSLSYSSTIFFKNLSAAFVWNSLSMYLEIPPTNCFNIFPVLFWEIIPANLVEILLELLLGIYHKNSFRNRDGNFFRTSRLLFFKN